MAAPSADEYLRDAERRDRRWSIARGIAVAIGLAIVIGVGAYFMLNRIKVDDARALEALRSAGLHEAKLGGAVTAACGEGESSRHFTAKNASEQPVEGTLCCGATGAFKGCTIRWGH